MSVGICFGGYAPMHRGHLDLIMRAKKEHDHVLVIVCGYDGEPRGKEIGCDLFEREPRVRMFFDGDEQVRVEKINDTKLGLDESMSHENWKIWTKEVERLCQINFKENPTQYYVAEPFYKQRLEEIGKEAVLMERELPISGTKIRENPIKYWDYIVPTFRDLFSSGILITGTASEGKTTLCNDIARYFGIRCTSEYGRMYMESHGITDDKLELSDFKEFVHMQIPSVILNDKIWISDTDNLVTLMYAKAYSERSEMAFKPEDYEILKKEVQRFKWKKIFMLPPHFAFVDDGTRYMPQATMEEREKNYEILKELMQEYGYEYEELRGTYYQNFLSVKNYIQTL